MKTLPNALTHQSYIYSHLYFSIFYLRNDDFYIIPELVFELSLVYVHPYGGVCGCCSSPTCWEPFTARETSTSPGMETVSSARWETASQCST